MTAKHMPPGTQAAILRAVVHERHPKIALPAIAHRFSTTYDVVRQIIDAHGYPDNAKMRQAAVDLELQEHAAGVDAQAVETVEQSFRDQPNGRTYEKATGDVQPDPVSEGGDVGHLMKVRLADLAVDPDNLRELPSTDDPSIVELADTIAELGLLQPITARRHDGRLVIVMGHRRYVALKRLKWTTTDVIVRGPMLPADVIAAMLVENGQRKDLNPIEEARGLRLLKTRDELSDLELARKVGRSQPYVSNRLALLSLSAEDQAAIIAGDMTMVEGTAKGRMNSGRVKPSGQDKNWHLGPNHNLAQSAKARCRRLGHLRGRRVGGMACGECWESVIRADARQDFVDISQRSGNCVICEQPVERQVEPMAAGR